MSGSREGWSPGSKPKVRVEADGRPTVAPPKPRDVCTQRRKSSRKRLRRTYYQLSRHQGAGRAKSWLFGARVAWKDARR